jgi:hypothetical protein
MDARRLIKHGRYDATAIFLDMPLCDVPRRYNVTIVVGDRLSEYPLALVKTQRVMTQHAVPEIRTHLTFLARAHFLKSGGKL